MQDAALESILDRVQDEDTFLNFLSALSEDRADEVRKEKIEPGAPHSPGANGWEHGTIEDFLEAAAAWGEDSKDGMPFQPDGPLKWRKPENPWRRCAEILFMGKHYE